MIARTFVGPLILFASVAGLIVRALPSGIPASPIRFQDVAVQSGIRAEMRCGGPEKRFIPEANGSGAAWLDYDRDGLLDLLIVNGSTMDDLRTIVAGQLPPAREGSLYLYRNLGDGSFEDATARAGLSNPYWGTGIAVADFNNDGYPDLLITNIGLDLLFRNNGNGTFTEIGRQVGLSRKIAWHTGAAFGDYDGDGRLDLYVAGYVDLNALRFDRPPTLCEYRGVPGFCGPKGLKGERDILYHNNSDGTFTEVTEKAGVTDSGLYHGFTVVFDDFNHDGKIDIFVANDSDPNYLYLNQGDGVFKEAGLVSGVAFNGDGRTQSNMGVAVGDFDNDGLIDLMTTTFSEDYFPLFRQLSPGRFEDISAQAGLGTVTMPWVGWACGFADFDNDGYKDLWTANGHVYPKADLLHSSTYLQPIAVLANRGGKFVPVLGLTHPKMSYRGGCAGDFNNDGKIDLVVLPIVGAPVLLENRTESQLHWIGFDLRGRAGNRDGIGAQVRIEHCGRAQLESLRNGGSYLSHNDQRIHFGLGSCAKVDRVTVVWPNGARQVLEKPQSDRYVLIEEPM